MRWTENRTHNLGMCPTEWESDPLAFGDKVPPTWAPSKGLACEILEGPQLYVSFLLESLLGLTWYHRYRESPK